MASAKNEITIGSLLFRIFLWIVIHINPDWSHRLMIVGLRDRVFPQKVRFDKTLTVRLWDKVFKNPIGVAAGVDKKGDVIDRLIEMGWGFGEFGSYTLEAEYPAKETFYLSYDKAILIQSLGYRNPGVSRIVQMLAARRHLPAIVGVNIASTAQNEGVNIKQGGALSFPEEFAQMAGKVAPYCDYITLNFTHPECELCALIAEKSVIIPIIRAVQEAVRTAAPLSPPKLLIKIPLTVSELEIPLIANMLEESHVDGVIIGGVINLSARSKKMLTRQKEELVGMLSGKPLKPYALRLIGQIYLRTNGRVPIVAAGGISTGQDAFEMIQAGASLIQINTAMVYKGPNVVNDINRDLAKLLKKKGYKSVQEAVGSAFI